MEDAKPFSFAAFETDRLLLRPLVEADIPFLFKIFSREETNVYTEFESITTLDDAHGLFEGYCVAKPGLFRHGIVIKATGELVGTIGLYGYTPQHRAAVVGYDLLKEHWGKGYATEAMKGLIDYAYENTTVNRIEGSFDPDNIASRRVLEKCGFTLEGTLRHKYFYRGKFRDDVVYSILREEWEKARE